MLAKIGKLHIDTFTKKEVLSRIENAIETLRPEAIYDVICSGGHFEFELWYDPNGLLPPTDEEIQK
jgi:hypothetical protein